MLLDFEHLICSFDKVMSPLQALVLWNLWSSFQLSLLLIDRQLYEVPDGKVFATVSC